MLKKIMFIGLFVSVSAIAGNITLQLDSEYTSGNKTYCIYADSQRSFTMEIPSSRSCPNTKTFKIN